MAKVDSDASYSDAEVTVYDTQSKNTVRQGQCSIICGYIIIIMKLNLYSTLYLISEISGRVTSIIDIMKIKRVARSIKPS